MAYKTINRNKRAPGKNPANPQHTLFKKLTRLLSGPIVNYRNHQIRQARRHRLDKYAKTFKSASGQQFKKKSYNAFDNLMANMMGNQGRSERYGDFDQMEFMPELASAMDIYADEITTHSDFGKVLNVDCPNEEIRSILETLFYQVLNIEFNIFGWARTMCKYGDFFLYLDIDEEIGIKSVIGLPTPEIERLEGEDPLNPNYVQYQWNAAAMTLENWQIAHFRILGNDKYVPYGTSLLDPARRIWRQLTLLEDAMMAHRVTRAPDRRIFYIDVGGINPEEVEQFMQKAMTQMKRHNIVDSQTGHMDLRYNPASIEEDFWIPVRGGSSGTKIENLAGQTGNYTIDDVKYLRDKLFAAIKIPMSYLIRGEGGEEDKTTLAQKDIRFARTVQRLQRSLISELEKMALVHLYILGYKGEDLINFKLKLHNPSKIAQLQELEHWTTKLGIVDSATNQIFSRRWVSKHILGISEEEFLRNQRERFYDKKYDQMLEKAAAATGGAAEAISTASEMGGVESVIGKPEEAEGAEAGEAAAGGDEAALGAEMGGELGGEMGSEMGGEPEAPAEAPAGGEEGTLLASPEEAGPPPGKRDEYEWVRVKRKSPLGAIETTTLDSKGKWYMPKNVDGRQSGARKRHMTAQAGQAPLGTRGIFKGYQDIDALKRLERGIVSEEKSTYNKNVEKELFRTNSEILSLIESLEKKTNEVQT